jgi:hypothetical protein
LIFCHSVCEKFHDGKAVGGHVANSYPFSGPTNFGVRAMISFGRGKDDENKQG